MKKIIRIMLSLVMCLGLLAGCESSKDKKTENDKISVVSTIFPQYDWLKELVGEQSDKYDLTLLTEDSVDLHSYQPSAEDIAKMSSCDLFVYVGGESDGWVEDALKQATNKDMIVINLLDILEDTVKEEEVKEGMEAEVEEEEAEETEEDGPEYDEHVWLSVKNAEVISKTLMESLKTMDSQNADVYQKNYDNYMTQLKDLDEEYQTAVDAASVKTILFGDRFPFRYMVEDYGLDYYAAFVGCSAETEASFETIVFLAGKMDELKLPTVFTIENSDKKIANTIIENTTDKNQQVLVMNSLQSVTSKDIEAGYTYLSVMKENLETLKIALK